MNRLICLKVVNEVHPDAVGAPAVTSQGPVDLRQSNAAIEITDNDCRNDNSNEVPVVSVGIGEVSNNSPQCFYPMKSNYQL